MADDLALPSSVETDHTDGVRALEAGEFIQRSRIFARKSRDLMLPALREQAAELPVDVRQEFIGGMVRNRMEIVQDCYLTGVEEVLSRLLGSFDPEAWADDFDHKKRISELLHGLSQRAAIEPHIEPKQGQQSDLVGAGRIIRDLRSQNGELLEALRKIGSHSPEYSAAILEDALDHIHNSSPRGNSRAAQGDENSSG